MKYRLAMCLLCVAVCGALVPYSATAGGNAFKQQAYNSCTQLSSPPDAAAKEIICPAIRDALDTNRLTDECMNMCQARR